MSKGLRNPCSASLTLVPNPGTSQRALITTAARVLEPGSIPLRPNGFCRNVGTDGAPSNKLWLCLSADCSPREEIAAPTDRPCSALSPPLSLPPSPAWI
ncbi:hypothetical protein LY76DRAFT_112880 [Colletotrichum caudatum]|nr:hypothetical protein LY76DRAFT_112880 [Colletotrichum caudatum]